jgi:uncharacterized protein YbjT (DUF2867 family)
MFEIPAGTFPLVDPHDIAEVAATALTSNEYAGQQHIYVASDESGTDEIATRIGQAIGKPELRWSRYTPEAMAAIFRQFGFTDGAVEDYVEGFAALDQGVLYERYKDAKPVLGKVKLGDFVKAFAAAYRQ